MSGTLFVVATPIGNLEDITLRALRVLREVDVIAAEDTRRTAKLLAHYSISTSMVSFHEHNTRTRMPQLLARLEAGGRVALVTDAGTPGISDPGSELINACWGKAIAIDPIPGPSAPVTAAVASGFPLEPLTILGFAPARSNDRKKWLVEAQTIAHTFTFFESPHRILKTLSEAAEYFGDRPILIAREMTKLHQQLIRSSTDMAVIGQTTEPRGEFTVVVGPVRKASRAVTQASDQEIFVKFGQITDKIGTGRRMAVSLLAKTHGRSAKDVYAIIERLKQSGV